MESDNIRRKRQVLWGTNVLLFLFYLWLAFQIPYTHDDWDWGTANGIRYLLHATINSRYAGNLTEVLLTRSVLAKGIVMAAVFTAIPAVIERIAETLCRKELPAPDAAAGTLLGHGMILLMPVWIWQQTNGWVAGFSNYTVSALFVLLCVLTGAKVMRSENGKLKGGTGVFAFCLGLVTQLFLENITVVFVFAVAVIVLIIRIIIKRWNKTLLLMLLGSCLGCAVMFSSSIYSTLTATGSAVDGYRHFTFDRDAGAKAIVEHVIKYFLTAFPASIWSGNTVLCCTILFVLASKCLFFSRENRKQNLLLLLFAVDVLLFFYFLYIRVSGEILLEDERATNHLSAGVNWLFFIVCALQIFVLYRREPQKRWLLFGSWIAAPLVVFPMAAVSGADGRTFITPYIFLVLLLVVLFSDLYMSGHRKTRRLSIALAVILFAAGLLHVIPVYDQIGKTYRQQLEMMQSAGKTGEPVVIKEFPHKEWLWLPEPKKDSAYVEFYREFYSIPESAELRFEAWNDA